MKFIFPKNYKFSTKLLGFIDYPSAILILILGLFLLAILNIFIKDFNTKLFIFISLFFPILLFIIVNGSKENIICTILYIIKFFFNRNIYLYEKKSLNSKETNSKNSNFPKYIQNVLNKILQI